MSTPSRASGSTAKSTTPDGVCSKSRQWTAVGKGTAVGEGLKPDVRNARRGPVPGDPGHFLRENCNLAPRGRVIWLPPIGTPHEMEENTMRSTILSAAALATAAMTLCQLAPASADSIGVSDPADIYHGVDLRSAVIDHNANNVVITTTHTNLRASSRSGSAGTVYLDTDASHPGPEYVYVGGYYDGTDYQLVETDGFGHREWGKPVVGSYRMRLDYENERVRMRIARDAIGAPDEVRVAVRVSGTRRDGTSRGLVDWLGEPRSFTDPVTQEGARLGSP